MDERDVLVPQTFIAVTFRASLVLCCFLRGNRERWFHRSEYSEKWGVRVDRKELQRQLSSSQESQKDRAFPFTVRRGTDHPP